MPPASATATRLLLLLPEAWERAAGGAAALPPPTQPHELRSRSSTMAVLQFIVLRSRSGSIAFGITPPHCGEFGSVRGRAAEIGAAR